MNDPPSGNERNYLQRCDQAVLQLFYGVENVAGPYADCFDHVGPNPKGLRTMVTVTALRHTACVGERVTIRGRLEVADLAVYDRLGGNPLAGRTIIVDRNTTLGWRTIQADGTKVGPNWSLGVRKRTPGTRQYTFRFEKPPTEGLARANPVTVTVTWLRPADCR